MVFQKIQGRDSAPESIDLRPEHHAADTFHNTFYSQSFIIYRYNDHHILHTSKTTMPWLTDRIRL